MAHIPVEPTTWQKIIQCERQIARLDEQLKDDALYEDWISIESRIEAIRHLALMGERIDADHLCDYEIGHRVLTRLDARSFPEAVGTRRAVLSVCRPTFPVAPDASEVQDLFFRSLAVGMDTDWQIPVEHDPDDEQDLAALALRDVYGDDALTREGQGGDMAVAPIERTIDKEPVGTVFDELSEGWASLPAEKGLLSVARGMRGVFRMIERFPGAEGMRGFTHLALLAAPMLIRRYCGVTRPLGFMSSVISRRSDEFRESVHKDEQSWENTFVDLLAESLDDNNRRLIALKYLRDSLAPLMAGKRKKATFPDLVALLFRQPTITIGTATNDLRVDARTATRILNELEGVGFVRIRGNRTRYRVWEAYRVLELIRRG